MLAQEHGEGSPARRGGPRGPAFCRPHLLKAIGAESAVRVRTIRDAEATRPRLPDELRSGAYDIIHYAGPAYFDAESPDKSGIFCAGEEAPPSVLSP